MEHNTKKTLGCLVWILVLGFIAFCGIMVTIDSIKDEERNEQTIEKLKMIDLHETICRDYKQNVRPCIETFIIDGIEMECFIAGSGRSRAMSCNWDAYNFNRNNRKDPDD